MTGEAEVLAVLGKIVAQWNYAEHCCRQIIRKGIPAGDIDDADHISLSKKNPSWMEDKLRDDVLPSWSGAAGEPYLKNLVEAFANAREYRNHYVHGVSATFPATPASPATAIIMPSKPHQNKTQAPSFATAADMFAVAKHIEELGFFACDVNNAFDVNGETNKQADGSPVVSNLPNLLTPLKPFPYTPLAPQVS